MRVSQRLLKNLRTVEVWQQVSVAMKTERDLLQLLRLAGVGVWHHKKISAGQWLVWRVE